MAKIQIEYPYILSVEETAKVFGIGEHTIRNLIKTDPTLPKLPVGNRMKINSGLFKEWLDKATKEGKILRE